jgi:hypothetical protein
MDTNNFSPMKSEGTEHLIERTYREGGQYQWVRETAVNAIEAGASRIEYGIEWQAVENKKIYRRTIADNGKGMTFNELKEFFNTFGKGGKDIGGEHENFGVGAKTSLLPWNKMGIAVVSWVNGNANMIYLKKDTETGQYGLTTRRVQKEDGEIILDECYQPYDDQENGLNWELVKPDWIEDHGTIITLLGNSKTDDTLFGDEGKGEEGTKKISMYLNNRFWKLDDVDIYVHELRHIEKVKWPVNEYLATNTLPNVDNRINKREIKGAHHFIEYTKPVIDGKFSSNGIVNLSDGTKVCWFLWDGNRPEIHQYVSKKGFIAFLYRNEIYDRTDHVASYRAFGITESKVRNNLWLIIIPPESGNRKFGVYPKTDRNSLMIKKYDGETDKLPISDWAVEFSSLMPDQIYNALENARSGQNGSITDDKWKKTLAVFYAKRFDIQKVKPSSSGLLNYDPTNGLEIIIKASVKAIREENQKPERETSRENTDYENKVGQKGGRKKADYKTTKASIPSYEYVDKTHFENEFYLACWVPNHVKYSEGCVQINMDHPVLKNQIEHWQSQYASHLSESIRKDIQDIYGQMAVSKIAHSEYLRGNIREEIINDRMRCEEALTMSLLGLISEEQKIKLTLGGKYGSSQKLKL